MSFAAIQQLLFGQRPRLLYCFTRGGVEYRFAAQDKPVTKAIPGVVGTVWKPSSIRHPRVTNSSQSVRAEFEVTLPLSDPFSQLLLAPVGLVRTSLRIWKYFANDPDEEPVVVYSGSLMTIRPRPGRAGSRDERTLSIVFGQSQNELNRRGLLRVAQKPCTWVIYGRGCRLNVEDWKAPATITGISTDGLELTVPEAALADDNTYRAGNIYWGSWSEMVLQHVGDYLVLAAPLPGLAQAIAADGAQAIDLAPGCDLTITGPCSTIFGNDDNFGGLPRISDTPFDGRSIV